MTLPELLSIIIPSALAAIGVLASAIYLRHSQREANKNAAEANDTNAFKVVTDQLFADNKLLRDDVNGLKEEVKQLKDAVANKDQKIDALEEELEETDSKFRHQLDITRQLANYIKRLITFWPLEAGPPPSPEPPIDWEKHLA